LAKGVYKLKTESPSLTSPSWEAKSRAFFLAMEILCPLLVPLMTTEEQRQKNPLELTCTDVEILSRYVTDTGKILPRRITGFTALQQRHITKIIKQARNLLLMK
jgi:small subunit ribosomal protein S18